MSLDERLKAIIYICRGEGGAEQIPKNVLKGSVFEGLDFKPEPAEKRIEQIKQAFIDEGWMQALHINGKTVVMNGKDNLGYIVYYPDEVMTGQEWERKALEDGWRKPDGAN